MPPGRPSKYTEQIARDIVDRIAEGEPTWAVCQRVGIQPSTLFLWLDAKPGFSDLYARAKQIAMEKMADEIIYISDDNRHDEKFITDFEGNTIPVCNTEFVQRSKLKIDTRKWLMSKLAPKKYGDKITQEVTGAEGKAFTIEISLNPPPPKLIEQD